MENANQDSVAPINQLFNQLFVDCEPDSTPCSVHPHVQEALDCGTRIAALNRDFFGPGCVLDIFPRNRAASHSKQNVQL